MRTGRFSLAHWKFSGYRRQGLRTGRFFHAYRTFSTEFTYISQRNSKLSYNKDA